MDLCICPDNKWILSGSKDKTIKLWEMSTGQMIKSIDVDDVILFFKNKY